MSLLDDLFNLGQTTPKKEAKQRDTGIFGFGSNDQYKASGSTFQSNGYTNRSTDEALKRADETTCYSGSLICPICRTPKSSPSALEKCLAQHRADGYNC